MCLNHCNISVIDYSKMVSSLTIQKVIVKLFWQRKLIGQNIYTSENCIKQNTYSYSKKKFKNSTFERFTQTF